MTTVLTVCTGNVCRSPAAERLLAAGLSGPAPDVIVASAGTGALGGAPIDPPMADLIRKAGGNPDGFSARQLEAAHVRDAHLVLVMTRAHRAAVAALLPVAVRRTMLLTEAAELAASIASAGWPADDGADPASRLRALPRLAGAHRAAVGVGATEVVDPYRASAQVYGAAADTIAAAVARLVRALV